VHSGVRKNWLQRRFVLAGAVLSYFDDEGDKKGSIDLVAATSIRNSTCETAKGHEIEIETPDRTSTDQLCSRILCFFSDLPSSCLRGAGTYRLRAASEDEKDAWLRVLAASVGWRQS
jgi:hypothetical protein